jgi:hypothetical protein
MVVLSNENKNLSIHDPIKTLDQDKLGRKDLAQKILDRLGQTDAGALGVYGGWGTGKSSLLNLLCVLNKEKIDQTGKADIYVTIIDAWKYEMAGSLFVPIISSIVKFAKKEDLSGDAYKRYLKRMGKMALLGVSDIVLRKVGFSVEDVKNLMQDVRSESGVSYLDWENIVDEMAKTQEAFSELIQVSLNGLEAQEGYMPNRIVFCVDNLDRCAPENAINLLESIKNFLIVPGCAWVLAVDSDVIASYVNKKYEGTAVNGYDYLDKIISEQYHLSILLSPENGGYVDEFLRSITLELPFGPQLDWKRFAHIPRIWRPRRLIKCARTLLFANRVTGINQLDTTFALIMLYHTWPDFYEILSYGSESHIEGVLANFGDLETAWSKRIKISINPKFITDSDLRYFIQHAFLKQSEVDPKAFIRELIFCTNDLRQVGLP